MQRPARNPYKGGIDAFFNAKLQFAQWKDEAPDLLKRAVLSTHRGTQMVNVHSLLADTPHEQTVQVWFGKRPISHLQKINGTGVPIEEGATLLYSLGPTGDVAVTLYPARSDAHRMQEDHIRLELKRMSINRMRRVYKQHVRDLVAYQFYSSLQGKASWLESCRVQWLRNTSPVSVGGQTITRAAAPIAWVVEKLTQAAIGAFAVPIAMVLLVIVFTWLGWEFAADFLTDRLTKLAAGPI